jgi:hypothetical protein
MELRGSEKQIKWATSIRKDRIAQWGKSALYPDVEVSIIENTAAAWWIAHRDQSVEDICSMAKAQTSVLVDFTLWTLTDTPTGIKLVGPTKDVVTGEVLVDDGTLPF